MWQQLAQVCEFVAWFVTEFQEKISLKDLYILLNVKIFQRKKCLFRDLTIFRGKITLYPTKNCVRIYVSKRNILSRVDGEIIDTHAK